MIPTTVLDSHVHFWDTLRLHYEWLKAHPGLNQPLLFPDLRQAVGTVPVRELVFVQADCHPDEALAEAHWIAAMAADIQPIRGIVAYAPVDTGDAVRLYLKELAQEPLVKGVRRLIQSERHTEAILKPDYVTGVQICAEFGFTYDLCLYHHQLPATIELVRRCPEVNFVLDHVAKPAIRQHQLDPWRAQLQQLADFPNVVCKLSGLMTEADHRRWSPAELQPYLQHAIACFGPTRILYGSDWPVCTLAGSYAQWFGALESAIADLPHVDREALYRGNARRVYRLAPAPDEQG